MKLSSSLRTLAFAGVCALPLPAGVLTFNFTETGGNVVVTASGSITDSTAWSYVGPVPAVSYISPDSGTISPSGPALVYGASGANTGTWTGSFGSSSSSAPSSYLGDVVGFIPQQSLLALPVGYSIGTTLTPLSSTMSFTGATFTTLGITPVAQSAVFGGDTIQLTFGAGGGSSVPDAGPGPALALLLGGLGLRQWRSSRRARAAT